MNKRIMALLLSLLSSPLIGGCLYNPGDSCDCKATSKTFFSVRPPYQLNSPEFLASFHDRINTGLKQCRNGAVQFTAFGGQSLQPDLFSKYFMFDCKQRLHITGKQTSTTDILAEQLNIYSQGDIDPATLIPSFESFIEFEPKYTFAGLGVTYKQEFAHRADGRSFWFLVSAPVTWVSTTMGISEQVISDGGGVSPLAPNAVPNATEAFTQRSWNYGVINCDENTKLGLADITALVGYEIIRHDQCAADTFFGVIFPTGNAPSADYLFEPVVGHNHHYGFVFGSSFAITFWECGDDKDRCLRFELDAHGQMMLDRCEIRSFDLRNKPWSRYMQVYIDQDQAEQAYNVGQGAPVPSPNLESVDALTIGTPGINVFTQPVRVYPGFAHVSNSAFVYTHCNFQGEMGYNFYGRQAECVELSRPWLEGPALKSLLGNGETDSVQLIGNNYNNNNAVEFTDGTITPPTPATILYKNNVVSAEDLNLCSAAHPAVLTHTFYGAVSYRNDERKHPVFFGAGGSYEFSGDNTTMHRWMVWAKGGLSF